MPHKMWLVSIGNTPIIFPLFQKQLLLFLNHYLQKGTCTWRIIIRACFWPLENCCSPGRRIQIASFILWQTDLEKQDQGNLQKGLNESGCHRNNCMVADIAMFNKSSQLTSLVHWLVCTCQTKITVELVNSATEPFPMGANTLRRQLSYWQPLCSTWKWDKN